MAGHRGRFTNTSTMKGSICKHDETANFRTKNLPTNLLGSKLYAFYPVLMKDLKRCQSEVIVESLPLYVTVWQTFSSFER